MSDPAGLELTFLGTGNAFSQANRYWGAILVNNKILLDASPIIVPHMKNLEKDLGELEFIFITHYHGDHFLGLPFLLLDFAYLSTTTHPLTLIGPVDLKDRVTQITNLSFPGVFEKLSGKLKINYFEITEPGDYESSGQQFRALPVIHGNHVAFGYSLNIAGKVLAYSGDTDLCDGLFELGDGADILIIEMSNPNDEVPGHMSLKKLGKLQEKLSKDLKIILNHVGPIDVDFLKNDNVILPGDLEVIKF